MAGQEKRSALLREKQARDPTVQYSKEAWATPRKAPLLTGLAAHKEGFRLEKFQKKPWHLKEEERVGRELSNLDNPRDELPEGCPRDAERVDVISQMMIDGEWKGPKKHPDLQLRWGVTSRCLKRDERVARIHLERVLDPQKVRARVGMVLDKIVQNWDTDRKAAVMAARELNEVAGLKQKKITIKTDVERMTDEELLAHVENVKKQIGARTPIVQLKRLPEKEKSR